jgi:hypothetical protein
MISQTYGRLIRKRKLNIDIIDNRILYGKFLLNIFVKTLFASLLDTFYHISIPIIFRQLILLVHTQLRQWEMIAWRSMR